MNDSSLFNRSLFLKLIKKEVTEEEKKPVFESYKNVCRIMGNEEIDYLEFEYFYMAFYQTPDFNGTNYDRRISLPFSALPMEIHSQILRKLDPIHRLIVRKVSKRLRTIIDDDSPRVKNIMFTEKNDGSGVSIIFDDENQIVNFLPKGKGGEVQLSGWSSTLPDIAHQQMALNFLRSLFLNPKLKLKSLTVWCDCEVKYLIEFLTEIMKNSLKSQFHVENLVMSLRKPIELTSITALLKPGILETIDVIGHQDCHLRLINLMETPHFKQAKVVTSCRCEPLNSPLMIEKFLHLTAFEVRVRYVSFEDLRWLRKIISKSPTVKQCNIYLFFQLTMELIEKAFPGADLELLSDACYYDYPIPNSHYFLSFRIRANLIEVEKKMRE